MTFHYARKNNMSDMSSVCRTDSVEETEKWIEEGPARKLFDGYVLGDLSKDLVSLLDAGPVASWLFVLRIPGSAVVVFLE